MKKTILFYYAQHEYYRNYFTSGFLEGFSREYNVEIMLGPSYDEDEYRQIQIRNQSKYVVHLHNRVGGSPNFRSRILKHLFFLRWFEARNRSNALFIKKGRLPLKKRMLYYCLSTPTITGRIVIQLINRFIGVDSRLTSLIENIRPDVICIPSNLSSKITFDFVKIGRLLGIKICSIVAGWDNLVSKGAIIENPDIVAVWGEQMLNEAKKVQLIPDSKIRIIGTPRFEHYYNSENNDNYKKILYREYGIPANHKLILVAGSNFLFDILPVLEKLESFIETGIFGQFSVIYRPHPWGRPNWKEKDFRKCGIKHIHLDKQLEEIYDSRFLKDTKTLERSKLYPDLDYYNKLLKSVDAFVGPYTTIALEAALNKIPILSLAYDDGINYRIPNHKIFKFSYVQEFIKFPGVLTCFSFNDFSSDFAKLLELSDSDEVRDQLFEATRFTVDRDSRNSSMRFKTVLDELTNR